MKKILVPFDCSAISKANLKAFIAGLEKSHGTNIFFMARMCYASNIFLALNLVIEDYQGRR